MSGKVKTTPWTYRVVHRSNEMGWHTPVILDIRLRDAAEDLRDASILALELLRGCGFTEKTAAIIELKKALKKAGLLYD